MNQKPSQSRLTFSRSHVVVSRMGARPVLDSRATSAIGQLQTFPPPGNQQADDTRRVVRLLRKATARSSYASRLVSLHWSHFLRRTAANPGASPGQALAGKCSNSAIDALQLPLGHRDRALGVFAFGAIVCKHIHHEEVGDGGRRLLARGTDAGGR